MELCVVETRRADESALVRGVSNRIFADCNEIINVFRLHCGGALLVILLAFSLIQLSWDSAGTTDAYAARRV